MNGGFVRVTALRPFRRGGFAFGPEAVVIDARELLPQQLQAIVEESMLRVEISVDGETWVVPDVAMRGALVALSKATAGMSREEFAAAYVDGSLDNHLHELLDASRPVPVIEPEPEPVLDPEPVIEPEPVVEPDAPATKRRGAKADS